MRRNKQQLACMRSLVLMWLDDCNNNPQDACNEYIRWHLINNVKLPSHVKGIQDFIKLSKENQASYDHMVKVEEKREFEKVEIDNTKEKIANISLEEIQKAWKKAKATGTQKEIISICDAYMHIYNGQTWMYNYNDIHILKEYGLI